VRNVSDQGGGPHGPLARQMCCQQSLSIGATLNLSASESAKVTELELIPYHSVYFIFKGTGI
jgi:hypothetical protein